MQPMNQEIVIGALKSNLDTWDDYFVMQLHEIELL